MSELIVRLIIVHNVFTSEGDLADWYVIFTMISRQSRCGPSPSAEEGNIVGLSTMTGTSKKARGLLSLK